jgi:hypothetical protein
LLKKEIKMPFVYVFHQGERDNGQLWFSVGTPSTNVWEQDANFGEQVQLSASPSAVVYNGQLCVFYRQGGDGSFPVVTYWDQGYWYENRSFSNALISESPSAVVYNGLLYVFHQGYGPAPGSVFTGDEQLWYTVSEGGPGANWVPDQQVMNVGMWGSPSAVVYNGLLYVFHQGYHANGELWFSYFDGDTWSADTQIHNLGMSGSPSAVVWRGGITVFHQGYGNNGQLWYTYSPDGSDWGTTQTDAQVLGVGMSGSPSAVVYNGVLCVFYQGYGEDGQLWYSTYDGTTWGQTPVSNVGMSSSPGAVVFS